MTQYIGVEQLVKTANGRIKVKASGGIGQSMVKLFAEDGAKVVLCAHRGTVEAAEKLCAEGYRASGEFERNF